MASESNLPDKFDERKAVASVVSAAKDAVVLEVAGMVRETYKSIPSKTATPLISTGYLLLAATILIKFIPSFFNEMTGDEFTMLIIVSLILMFGGAAIRLYLFNATVEQSKAAAETKIDAVNAVEEVAHQQGQNLG